MNKSIIRNSISTILQTHPSVNVLQTIIEQQVSEQIGTSLSEVERELIRMQEEGLVQRLPTQPANWRLTSLGEQATAPLSDKAMHYLSGHWEALLAITIAIIALFKNH